MSKTIFAKDFSKEYEYDAAKRKERKENRNFRDTRKTRKSVWSNTSEE